MENGLFLLVVLLIILVLWLLWKIVAEPELSVETDKAVYLKGETVKISGNLSAGGEPLSDKSVTIYITPPEGDVIGLPTVKTDTEGNYSNSWIVLSGAVLGSYSMRATSLGIEATATFTC